MAALKKFDDPHCGVKIYNLGTVWVTLCLTLCTRLKSASATKIPYEIKPAARVYIRSATQTAGRRMRSSAGRRRRRWMTCVWTPGAGRRRTRTATTADGALRFSLVLREPQRVILERAGIEFTVIVSNADESNAAGRRGRFVKELSRRKLEAVLPENAKVAIL